MLRRQVPPLERIGLQLYTVRELMQADVARTLERVAKVGYLEVEFAGYFGETPRRIRGLLDSLGLEAPSTHLSLRDLGPDLPRTLDLAETMGHRYLVVPSLDPLDRRNLRLALEKLPHLPSIEPLMAPLQGPFPS